MKNRKIFYFKVVHEKYLKKWLENFNIIKYTGKPQTDNMVDEDISYKNSQISSTRINIVLRYLTSCIIACI